MVEEVEKKVVVAEVGVDSSKMGRLQINNLAATVLTQLWMKRNHLHSAKVVEEHYSSLKEAGEEAPIDLHILQKCVLRCAKLYVCVFTKQRVTASTTYLHFVNLEEHHTLLVGF